MCSVNRVDTERPNQNAQFQNAKLQKKWNAIKRPIATKSPINQCLILQKQQK